MKASGSGGRPRKLATLPACGRKCSISRGQREDPVEAVRVVREEQLLAGEVLFDGLEALADVRVHARVDEGDAPVVDVAVEELDLLAAVVAS